ncbi:hypothetical protein F5I97DRAFT_1922750 [Phlebopus sp. FC_14]|nr:hypothetical protein F5I97DRAFT_1922750 [Phlebopus sp. FC_14]
MPFHIVKAEPLYHGLKPVKHGFSIHGVLGNAEKENPATFGIWSVDASNPITSRKHPHHSFAAVTEGELWLEDLDEQTERVALHAGDIFHVTVGTSVRWGTETKGKGTVRSLIVVILIPDRPLAGIFVHLTPTSDSSFVEGLE